MYVPVSPVRLWGIELEAGWKSPLDDVNIPRGNVTLYCIWCLENHRGRYYCAYCHHHHSVETESRQSCYRNFLETIGRVSRRQILTGDVVKKLNYRWIQDTDGSIQTNAISAEIKNDPPAPKLTPLKYDVKTLFGLIVDVNQTMGSHIHASFGKQDPIFYKLLMSWEFVDFFQCAIKDSGMKEVIERLCNRYCREHPSKTSLRNNFNSHRGAINFPFSSHGSIEFRVFPMVKEPERIWEYFDFISNTIHEFLSKTSHGTIKPVPLVVSDPYGFRLTPKYKLGQSIRENGRY